MNRIVHIQEEESLAPKTLMASMLTIREFRLELKSSDVNFEISSTHAENVISVSTDLYESFCAYLNSHDASSSSIIP